jgi:hypothetical protein
MISERSLTTRHRTGVRHRSGASDQVSGGADAPVRWPTPWSASTWVRNPAFSPNYPGMALYRRPLAHDYETNEPVFLTWRLHDSLPCHRPFQAATVNSGQAFAAMDRLPDEAPSGPFYLRHPALADMVVEATTPRS